MADTVRGDAAIRLCPSLPDQVPQLKQLWKLSFGDEDAYIDHFFAHYYRPERMLVLEEDGVVRAMTAWFDTDFRCGAEVYRAAYLYAVATHPDCRGNGFAGRLLAYADEYLCREQGFACLTTVPARPELHAFFGRSGFRECFVLTQQELDPEQLPTPEQPPRLLAVDGKAYGQLREQLLSGQAHIAYSADALDYQAGCCRMSGGGLFAAHTLFGPVCLCAEGAGEGLVMVKEVLGSPNACSLALAALTRSMPGRRWLVRRPAQEEAEGMAFAMLKWMEPRMKQAWEWNSRAYLGLAFD